MLRLLNRELRLDRGDRTAIAVGAIAGVCITGLMVASSIINNRKMDSFENCVEENTERTVSKTPGLYDTSDQSIKHLSEIAVQPCAKLLPGSSEMTFEDVYNRTEPIVEELMATLVTTQQS